MVYLLAWQNYKKISFLAKQNGVKVSLLLINSAQKLMTAHVMRTQAVMW